MFCYQCEQTAKGSGCVAVGVCGKEPEVAALQDLIVYGLKGLSVYAHRAAEMGATDDKINLFLLEGLFSTVTNVNFDAESLSKLVLKLGDMKDRAQKLYEQACVAHNKPVERFTGAAEWKPAKTIPEMIAQAEKIGVPNREGKFGKDINGLMELLTYGLKGMAAYADHAHILGKQDESVFKYMYRALDYLTNENPQVDALLKLNLECGEVNIKVMALLDAANTETYGNPVPTPVRIHPKKGKAILVSGHDLKDIDELLKQTQGKGINIYTHGEMLPTHAYPGLKKYPHLVGNYGGAWQDQRTEFDAFPGAILMTTNCIQKPKDSYKSRIFTTGLVGFPGVAHIKNHDFTPVIEAALAAEGFKEDGPDNTILVGFGHATVMSVAGKVIDLVKRGAIRRFFLIGGCDGAKSGRNYYTQLATKVPADCIILTLACGKYRFNKLEFGDIEGIPRLLDIGQCNDAYSAIQIAVALANAFQTDVNSLPLSMILSWYEQKAVVILLSLLHLGIKNIRLGPSLPAFVTPAVLDVLVKLFNIMPISTPDADLEAILG